MRYVITGAARGIGRAVSRRLGDAGHEVYGILRAGGTPADDLGLSGRAAVDLAAVDTLAPSLRRFVADVGGVDGLVHAAGIVSGGTLAQTTAADFTRQFALNVTAVAEITRIFLPGLRATEGTVVLVNSGSGLVARTPLAAYGASKFALRSYADSLRLEEPSIRVSSIYPGRVDTDMQHEVRALEDAPYDASDYLRVDTVADVIVSLLMLPGDGVITDLSLRPRPRR